MGYFKISCSLALVFIYYYYVIDSEMSKQKVVKWQTLYLVVLIPCLEIVIGWLSRHLGMQGVPCRRSLCKPNTTAAVGV